MVVCTARLLSSECAHSAAATTAFEEALPQGLVEHFTLLGKEEQGRRSLVRRIGADDHRLTLHGELLLRLSMEEADACLWRLQRVVL